MVYATLVYREDVVQWLKARQEKLRKELEIIEYLINLLESHSETESNYPGNNIVVSYQVDGVHIIYRKPVKPSPIIVEYLIRRLEEIAGENYTILKEPGGKIKGVIVKGDINDRLIVEVKSLLRTIMLNK